ncbi:hypothetical protein HPB50_007710 [Hyalomma asiaticum]|uniref:Uncharacterized protein n=1 Tax=Hyalomma asiaticum TaxID=266040 RepID=A0ACB7TGM9_HYAAI|nr:hypothetical protein HPB50_007710 [Hyalomma asiaticum]
MATPYHVVKSTDISERCSTPKETVTPPTRPKLDSRRSEQLVPCRNVCGVSIRGFNRYIVVREMWKTVNVPGLMLTNFVVCVTTRTCEWLECRQREAGQIALGCHGRVATEALQGDIGWSSFEAREACSKIAFEAHLLLGQAHFATPHSKSLFGGGRSATKSGDLRSEAYDLGQRGTPHGSVISPLLFNVAMQCLDAELAEMKGIGSAIYVDDIALWCSDGFDGHGEDAIRQCIT